MPDLDLSKEPTLHRGPVSRGLYRSAAKDETVVNQIDHEGGKYGAGIIRGMSVITRGEALGHGEWIDHVMLSQVAEANKAANGSGVKSRFAHPDMSGDGIGKMTGKTFDAQVLGDQVIADWHALKSARNAPDGDLAGYIMNLATEAPEAFGTSISFMPDYAAMRKFRDENMVEYDMVDSTGQPVLDSSGQPVKGKRFQSPDPKNKKNLMHVRLKELIAVDVVDEPAANPGGLFHRGQFDLLENGDRILEYVFGMTEDTSEVPNLGIDPSRIRGFVNRFCQTRGISFHKGDEMTQATANAPATDSAPASNSNGTSAAGSANGAGTAAPGTGAQTFLSAAVTTLQPGTIVPAGISQAEAQKLSKEAADEAVKSERKRAADITALCKQAGHSELAAGFIDDGSTVESTREKLFTTLCNERPPIGQDLGRKEETDQPKGPNAKFIAEYKASADLQAAMTEEEYIAGRRIDEGLDVLGSSKAA